MKINNNTLNAIIALFPNYSDRITELFCESESFRAICKDYYDCKTVIDESIKVSNKYSDLLKEYEIMLSEIEEELIERITD